MNVKTPTQEFTLGQLGLVRAATPNGPVKTVKVPGTSTVEPSLADAAVFRGTHMLLRTLLAQVPVGLEVPGGVITRKELERAAGVLANLCNGFEE